MHIYSSLQIPYIYMHFILDIKYHVSNGRKLSHVLTGVIKLLWQMVYTYQVVIWRTSTG